MEGNKKDEHVQGWKKSELSSDSGLITLKFVSTHDTGLKLWFRTRFNVIGSTGEIIMWGKSCEQGAATLHLFQRAGTGSTSGWEKIRTVRVVCNSGHESFIFRQMMTVDQKEVLAVSCPVCLCIKLYDFNTEEMTTAYHSPDHRLGPLCQGENNTVYLLSLDTGLPVLELDCAQLPFTGPTKIIQSGIEGFYGMCYIPSPYKLLVFSGWEIPLIRAVSVVSGEMAWEVAGSVDGRTCCPRGMTFSSKRQALFLADGWNSRILVLSPQDGQLLQSLSLEMFEIILDLELRNNEDELVILHKAKFLSEKEYEISFFSIH